MIPVLGYLDRYERLFVHELLIGIVKLIKEADTTLRS